ncbi:MAG TPA: hypothetical protein VN329_05590 [Roseomonas sp.]|nr:hypothetical protein [Roseomonas sp.]
MRRCLALLVPLLLPATAPRAEDAEPRICVARFGPGDLLALEPRFVGLLAGDGCAAGDLLHFSFIGEGVATAVAARHCRFDRPVLFERGTEVHLVCVWHGAMRRPLR